MSLFTNDGLIHGVLTNHKLWHGTAKELPKPGDFIVMVALTNNQSPHPLLENRHKCVVETFALGLGITALIIQRGLTVFAPDERQSRSRVHHSSALYLYSSHHDHHCTLLQVLPPFSVTSCHYHKWITEDYYSLAGRCIIGTKDSLKGTPVHYQELAGQKYTVPRRVIHQTANPTEQFAVNYLIMRGLARPLKHPTQMDDHYYVEPSPFTFSPSI